MLVSSMGTATLPAPPQTPKRMSAADETSPSVCEATTRYGTPCTRTPIPGKRLCHSHDPEYAEVRKQNSRAGGRAAKSPFNDEINEVKTVLWELIRQTKAHEIQPQLGSTVIQAANTILRAIDFQRKIVEQDEVLERLDALEHEKVT